MQPFLNYNFEGGPYLTTSPIITVNWEARGSQHGPYRWAAASVNSSKSAGCR